MYDSSTKKLKFTCGEGSREVTADWDNKHRAITCKVPPFSWLFEGEEVGAEHSRSVEIGLTFNNQEWMPALSFSYHDCTVTRLEYADNFGEELETEEEKEAAWLAVDPEPVPPEEEPTEEDLAKEKEEEEKRVVEKTEELTTLAKRSGTKMYLFGENFVESEMRIICSLGDEKLPAEPIWKKEGKLGFSIPELGADVEAGEHTVGVEVSVNG